MENSNCSLCNSKEKIKIWSHKNDRFLLRLGLKKRLDFYLCGNCGLGYANPRLDTSEIQKLYTETYRDEEISEKHLNIKETYSKERIKFLRKYFPNMSGEVLEIGSSEGIFLKLLRDEEGFSVKGCEPYKPYAQYGISKWNIDTTLSFFQSSDFKDKFDLVAFMHVIEHIPDPVAFLNEISKVIKKDGLIFLETPNLARPYRGRITKAMFAAPHLIIYSPLSITNLLGKVGFEVLHIEEKLNMRVIAKYRGDNLEIHKIKKDQLQNLKFLYKKHYLIESKILLQRRLKKNLVKIGQKILPPEVYQNIRTLFRNEN